MQQPKYKPEHWVIFKQGEAGGLGQITGAVFNQEGWKYTIRGTLVDGGLYSIREEDVAYLYNADDKSWTEPTRADGQTAAYTNL